MILQNLSVFNSIKILVEDTRIISIWLLIVATPYPPHPKMMTHQVFTFTRNPELSKGLSTVK